MTRARAPPIIKGFPPETKIDRIKKNAPTYSAAYELVVTFILTLLRRIIVDGLVNGDIDVCGGYRIYIARDIQEGRTEADNGGRTGSIKGVDGAVDDVIELRGIEGSRLGIRARHIDTRLCCLLTCRLTRKIRGLIAIGLEFC